MGENILYRLYEWYITRGLKPEKMPKHVAIIMDGNRRYSKLQGNMDVVKGHEIGVDTLEKVLDWSIELGIEIITVYAFSTENFNRPEHEVEGLMKLFVKNFKRLVDHEKIHRNEVKVKVVGRTGLIPESVREAIQEAEDATAHYNKRLFNIAIGYDGRLEIIDSFKNFELILAMTKGGPMNASNTLVYDVYLNGFLYYRVGFAEAIAFILLVIVAFFTIANFFIKKRWARPWD